MQEQILRFDSGPPPEEVRWLRGFERREAARTIRRHHYTKSVPSGKSYYMAFGDALVLWALPANKNAAAFLGLRGGVVWELSRLWAPDGHLPNLLTKAISATLRELVKREPSADAAISYADPSAGHSGGVYRAASWIQHGISEEGRAYRRASGGPPVARRAFHSGNRGLTKAEIEAKGYMQVRSPGKIRFVKPISKRAKRVLLNRSRAVVKSARAEKEKPLR